MTSTGRSLGPHDRRELTAESTARQSCNPKKLFCLGPNACQKSPLPPFDKGGLGGFQRLVANSNFSSQNLKILYVSSTEE
jgi:hypothetical protein